MCAAARGCAARSPRPPAIEPGPAGAAALAARLAALPCPDRLAADCEIQAEPAGGRAVRLYGSFRAAWPGRIRLQARFGPFVPIASIGVEPDSVTISLPRQKAYWAGRSSGGGGPAGLATGLLLLLCPSPLIDSMTELQLESVGKEWLLQGHGELDGREVTVTLRLDRRAEEIRELLVTDHEDAFWCARGATVATRCRGISSASPRPGAVRSAGRYVVDLTRTRPTRINARPVPDSAPGGRPTRRRGRHARDHAGTRVGLRGRRRGPAAGPFALPAPNASDSLRFETFPPEDASDVTRGPGRLFCAVTGGVDRCGLSGG